MPGAHRVLANSRNYSFLRERRMMHLIGRCCKLCTSSGAFTITISLDPHHTPEVGGILPTSQVRRLAHGGVGCARDHTVCKWQNVWSFQSQSGLLKGARLFFYRGKEQSIPLRDYCWRESWCEQSFWEKEIGKAHCQQSEDDQQEESTLRKRF